MLRLQRQIIAQRDKRRVGNMIVIIGIELATAASRLPDWDEIWPLDTRRRTQKIMESSKGERIVGFERPELDGSVSQRDGQHEVKHHLIHC